MMVKVDPLRDYYADLELPKNADDADIKRQFRKLALRWHPDRNPGHEDEFNAKFQAIQAAHEVLGDPVQRGRYDAERARAAYGSSGFGSRPAPPPRNTPASYSNYPPPPRRPPARPSPAPASAAYPSPSAPGASRYTPFARTFYPGKQKEESNSRTNATNAYRAWENMNRSAAGAARTGTNSAPFPPPPRPAKPTIDPSIPPRPPPRRPAVDSSTRGGKAANRHPHPHVERERHPESFEARRSNGRSSPERRSQHPSSRSDSYRRSTRVDDVDDDDDDDDGAGGGGGGLDGPRLSTPYSTRGGERTYLSGDTTLKRSATARGDVKGSSAERHRSASPIRNKTFPDQKLPGPRKTSNHVYGSAAAAAADVFLKPPVDPGPSTQRRRSRSHVQEHSFAHYVPSDTSSESSDRSEEGSPSFRERLDAANPEQVRRKNRHRRYAYPTYDPRQSQKRDAPDKAAGGGAGLGPPPRAAPAGRPDVQPQAASTVPNGHSASGSADKVKNEPPRYTFAVEDERYVPTPPSASAAGLGRSANINTQFSPADQHVKFTSNNADYFQQRPAGRGTPPAPRLSDLNVGAATPDFRSAQFRTQASNVSSNGTSDVSSTQDAPNPNISAQGPFKEDFWKEQLKQHTWEQLPHMPPSPIRPGPLHRQHSGTRQNPPRSGRSGIHLHRSATSFSAGRGATAAAMDSSDEEDSPSPSIPSSPRNSIRPVLEEQSAMDIDVLTPPAMKPASGGPGGTDVRPAAHFSGASQGGTGAGSAFPSAGAESARLSMPTSDGPLPFPTRRSADAGAMPSSSGMDLGGFNDVEPLAANAQGVTGVEDLRSSLPFPSRAAAELPVTSSFAPQNLELPPPPKAPEAPAIVTQSSWEAYLATMKVYMYEWTQFIDRMLAHFNERQREATESLTPNWLGMLSEGPGPAGGYLRYMQGVEEDFRVREHWDVAWEMHGRSMRAFGRVRAAVIDRGLKAA